jgi:hypothetical protein
MKMTVKKFLILHMILKTDKIMQQSMEERWALG